MKQECRYYPRNPPGLGYPVRRPHLNGPWQNANIMCFCVECDAKVEAEEVVGKYLNELCDCDVYTRWICHKCVVEERQINNDHYKNNTVREWDARYEESREISKIMGDHQHEIVVCKFIFQAQLAAGL